MHQTLESEDEIWKIVDGKFDPKDFLRQENGMPDLKWYGQLQRIRKRMTKLGLRYAHRFAKYEHMGEEDVRRLDKYKVKDVVVDLVISYPVMKFGLSKEWERFRLFVVRVSKHHEPIVLRSLESLLDLAIHDYDHRSLYGAETGEGLNPTAPFDYADAIYTFTANAHLAPFNQLLRVDPCLLGGLLFTLKGLDMDRVLRNCRKRDKRNMGGDLRALMKRRHERTASK